MMTPRDLDSGTRLISVPFNNRASEISNCFILPSALLLNVLFLALDYASHNMRNKIRIATWNVRKLKELGKLNTVCREMNRSNIQILGIAETNWNNSGSFKSHDSCRVIFSGRETGYSNGVAMILKKETANALIGI